MLCRSQRILTQPGHPSVGRRNEYQPKLDRVTVCLASHLSCIIRSHRISSLQHNLYSLHFYKHSESATLRQGTPLSIHSVYLQRRFSIICQGYNSGSPTLHVHHVQKVSQWFLTITLKAVVNKFLSDLVYSISVKCDRKKLSTSPKLCVHTTCKSYESQFHVIVRRRKNSWIKTQTIFISAVSTPFVYVVYVNARSVHHSFQHAVRW